MARNKKMLQRVTEEIEHVRSTRGFTGRMAGPRPPREMRPIEHKSVSAAGVRKMNFTDPDDNVMEHYPSKREVALLRGKRKRKLRRR